MTTNTKFTFQAEGIEAIKTEIANTTIHDFHPYTAGAASIEFRYGRPHFNPHYIINAMGDGWFRSLEGKSKGYGLAIVSIKVTSATPIYFDHHLSRAYKAKMVFIPSHTEEITEAESAFIYIHVHSNYTLDDVLSYMNSNSKNWRA